MSFADSQFAYLQMQRNQSNINPNLVAVQSRCVRKWNFFKTEWKHWKLSYSKLAKISLTALKFKDFYFFLFFPNEILEKKWIFCWLWEFVCHIQFLWFEFRVYRISIRYNVYYFLCGDEFYASDYNFELRKIACVTCWHSELWKEKDNVKKKKKKCKLAQI